MRSILIRLCLVMAMAFVLLSAIVETGSAQSTDTTEPTLESTGAIERAQQAVEAAKTTIQNLQADGATLRFNTSELVELQLELEDIGTSIAEVEQGLKTRLEAIKAREEALGPPPDDNESQEPESLAEERRELARERALVNADIGDATDVIGAASGLADDITEIRRGLFRQQLLQRVALSPESLGEAYRELRSEFSTLGSKISNWAGFTWRFKRGSLLAAVSVSVVLGILFIVAEYRLFAGILRRRVDDEDPSEFDRYVLAFWSTLLPVLGFAIFCELVLFFLDGFNVLRADIAAMLSAFLEFLVVLYFVGRLANAVLSPSRPAWRLVPVSDRGAHLLWWLIIAIALVNVGDYLESRIAIILNSPFILTAAKSLFAAVIIGIILLFASFVRPLVNADGSARPWPRVLRLPLFILGLGLIVLSVFGYVGLARFVATQIVVLGTLLVAMYLGFRAAKAISDPERFSSSWLGKYLSSRLNLGEVATEQFGLFAGLLLYLAILAGGIPIIFLIWGFEPKDIQNWVENNLSSFTIGDVTISLTGILFGVLVFVLGYFFTRWFQRWLDEGVMQRGRLEPGLRNSIRTAVGYAGIVLAAFVGLSIAGLNLSNLALVAGALSVGIGFGLQNIVNNFVSGLILLAERPFRVGDWVVTSSTQGFVKHISVRATEIETFQRQSVMVPNSELINSPVGNWTHRDRKGRVDIAVGVSYDSDPRRVIAILEEIGLSNELVMRDPSPGIIFMGFGDSSLDFELRVYLRDVLSSLSVATDLRLKIFERFKAEGIEIPFPQRDLHIKFPTEGGAPAEDATIDGLRLTPRTKKPNKPVDPDVD